MGNTENVNYFNNSKKNFNLKNDSNLNLKFRYTFRNPNLLNLKKAKKLTFEEEYIKFIKDENIQKITLFHLDNLENNDISTDSTLSSSEENNVKNTNLTIFDWDDTLFFTNFIFPEGLSYRDIDNFSEKEKELIKSIENCVKIILEKAILKGEVFIITNSSSGWVEFCSKKFYPEIFPLLKKIKIISARDLYEKQYPNDQKTWKLLTFVNIKNYFNVNKHINIICIGDAIFEIEASEMLASNFKNYYLKTIKFRENPGLSELNKQLNLIVREFDRIFSMEKSIKIHVEKMSKKS
jgi:hypothetical protein